MEIPMWNSWITNFGRASRVVDVDLYIFLSDIVVYLYWSIKNKIARW